jgi:hypothetical protein
VQANAKKHYSETVDHSNYQVQAQEKKAERFVIAGDEPTMQPKMWHSAMTDAAYYFDEPTLRQEVAMKKTLQHKYDSLFSEGWRPPLQSRSDLVSWVCSQHNNFMAERGGEQWNCENPRALIAQYGPNYESVKAKLGFIKGLQRD